MIKCSIPSFETRSKPWWCDRAQNFRDEKDGLLIIPKSERTNQQKTRIRVINGKIEGIKNDWLKRKKREKIKTTNSLIKQKDKTKFWNQLW